MGEGGLKWEKCGVGWERERCGNRGVGREWCGGA